MTPQQLKALLPLNSFNNKNEPKEKLYNLKELGIYFGKDPYTICRYIRKHKIGFVKSKKAKFGYHKYYRLKDLKNYKPSPYANRLDDVSVKNTSALTLFQRIKLLFGFDI